MSLQGGWGAATRFVSVVLAMLLAVTMVPAGGLQAAYADELAAGAEVTENGLRYVVADGAATLVGFEDGATLEDALAVPETVGDGATVKAVEVAEGQVADKVTSLTLPQTVESVRTEGLAAAFPALASIEVAAGAAGSEGGAAAKGAYSSVAGMLFRSAEGQASSDGEAFAEDALELVWAPPAMVVARIPLECKAIASGAFVDAAALETVMSFGKMESIASAERDGEDNVTKPGAFADEQIARLTIVVPGTNYAVTGEGAERVSGSVALSEKTDMLEKRKAWFHHGFDTEQIIMGAPFGEIEGVNAVSDEGVMEDRSLVTPLENGKSHLELTPEEEAEKAARRGEDPEAGLSFSYQASMDLSVRWAGDRSATPARVEIPAYAKVDGVTYQVTQVEPNAFEGAVFLASVAIPEGVTAIGESAFAGCTNLKEVSLPTTLKTIDYAAFKGCAFESVDIPESVRIIGGEAFADCVSLQSAKLSEAAHVGQTAFMGTSVSGDADGGKTWFGAGEAEATSDDAIAAFGASSVVGTRTPLPPSTVTALTPDHGHRPWFADYLDPGITAIYHSVHGADIGMEHWSEHDRYPAFKDIDSSSATIDLGDRFLYWKTSGGLPSIIARQEDGKLFVGMMGHRAVADSSDISLFQHAITFGAARTGGSLFGASEISWRENGPYGAAIASGSWGSWKSHSELAQFCGILTAGRSSVTFSTSAGLSAELTFPDSYKRTASEGGNVEVLLKPGERVELPNIENAKEGYYGAWKIAAGGSGSITTEGDKVIYTAGSTGTTVTATFARVNALGLDTNGGAWNGAGAPDKTAYNSGDTYTLPRNLDRRGFWFAGWYPATCDDDSSWKAKQDGRSLASEIVASDYGDVAFKAVWIPMTYIVDYNVDKGLIADIPDGVFIHPRAAMSLRAKTGFTWPDGTRYTGSDVVSGSAPDAYSFTNTDYIDLSGLSATTLTDFTLAEQPLVGYKYQGWCTADTLLPGETDPASGGVYTNVYTLVDHDGSLAIGESNMEAIFGANWQSSNEKPDPLPQRTLYCVWANTDMTTITLEANQPSFTNNAGANVVDADGRGDAEPGTQSIRFWNDHGYIGQLLADGADPAYTETAQPSTPVRTGSTEADTAIDTTMGLLAPVRYGFQFMGWGADDGTLYISYDENAGRTKNKEGFTLTKAAAALVEHGDDGSCALKADAPTTWKSVWQIREIEVSLRIPSPAVQDVDVTGASTKPGHDTSDSVNTNYFYDDYAWREGTSGETEGGATSGWYIAKRTWKYGDVLEMPAFKPRDGYYSYDGWFDAIKPSSAVSTDKALEADPSIVKIATFEGLRPHKANLLVNGASEVDKGLHIPDDFFLTGVDAGTMSKKELWLWVSPIRINVSSPIGIYLCQANSYGVAVDPYVVGNDTRTQLESRAEFQVAMNSHDLQIVGLEAEDVVDVTKVPETDDTGAETGNMIDKVTTVNDTGFTAADGFCRQIIEPKYKRVNNNFVNDNYHYGSAAEPNEGSRMFWVSPVPTATADQAGVIYGGSETAASAGGADAVGTLTAAEERELVPDVNKRRYFGYGYTLDTDDMKGVDGSTTVGGDKLMVDGVEVPLAVGTSIQDNTIKDTLDNTTSTTEYKLGDFVLRARDDAGNVLTHGLDDDERGLAYLGETAGGADLYRFYYGLDMRRCSFDLAGLQNIIENSEKLGYNSAFDQPLLKVKFTFAAARNEGISYYSARLGETVDLNGNDGISAETTISIAG